MNKIGKITEFLHYDWVQNKGYGTKRHREAILKYGTTVHHRKQFVETFLSKTDH
jgi:ribonuclease HII